MFFLKEIWHFSLNCIKSCECVCKPPADAHLPSFLWLLNSPTASCPSLAAATLPLSVALRSYHTSSDFIWPSPANQRPTSGWLPWQSVKPNMPGLKRWVEVSEWRVCMGGFAMRNSLRLTAPMEKEEQSPKWSNSAPGFFSFFVYVCSEYVCVHVTSFPLSPLPIPWTQWERVEWRAVCCCVWMQKGEIGL